MSQAEISTIEQASRAARGALAPLAKFPRSVPIGRGLSVLARPTEADPGHAVIPELNHHAAQTDPDAIDEHAAALTRASTLIPPPPIV